MKTYDEISRNILERRDEYITQQKAKRKKIAQITSAIGCFVLVAGIGFGLNQDKWIRNKIVDPGNLGGEAVHTAPLTTKKSTDNLTEDVTTTFPAIDTTSPLTTMPAIDSAENWTTSPTTDSSAFLTTVPPELYHEIDWSYRSTPGKFFAVLLDSGKYGDITIKSNKYSNFNEYVYPFRPWEEQATTRKATEFISDMRIEAYEPNGTVHEAVVDIFALEGLSENLAIGVRFPDDDRIYTYVNTFYIPKTLGEFLDAIDYDNTVTYGGITLYPGNNFPVNNKNFNDIKKYLLSDTDTANILNMSVTETSVTATIYCHELGSENKFFKISESGYISTNLIGYEYVFYVGKEATANFLKDSYNITFEQIKEIHAATMKTTEPYIADTTTSSANAPELHSATTNALYTITDPDNPMWRCGTEME